MFRGLFLCVFLFAVPDLLAQSQTNNFQISIDETVFPKSSWSKKNNGPEAFVLKEVGSSDPNKTVIRFYPENDLSVDEYSSFPQEFEGYRSAKKNFLSKYKGEIVEFLEPQKAPENRFDHYVYGVEFIMSGKRFLEINALGKCGEQLLAFKGLSLKKNSDIFKAQMKSLMKGVRCE